MSRRRPPIWLTEPTRFAAMPKSSARIAAILLILLLIAGFTSLASPAVADDAAQTGQVIVSGSVIAGLRAGGNYYQLTADALRAGSYPLHPFTTFRLPTHGVVQAGLPGIVGVTLFYLLAAGVAAAWWARLRPSLARPAPRAAVMLLLAGGTFLLARSDLATSHELWAGQLVALALVLRRPGRWIEAVALASMAMLVCEAAALFAVVMALGAWREGQRREVLGWAVALLIFAITLVVHAWAVAQVVNPLDPAAPGWTGPVGVGTLMHSLTGATAIQQLPLTVAAVLVPLAFFGWAVWRDPLGERVLAIIVAYAVIVATFASALYAWLLVAPVFLIGLVFVPDGLCDLGVALLDRGRVRVQRISQ